MMWLRLSIFLAFLSAFPAFAWDTKEHEPKGPGERDKWLSIYNCLSGSHGSSCSRNEHEILAQKALDLATPGHKWNIGERSDFTAIDLNVSLFRPDLAGRTTHPLSQAGDFPLERRTLPAPPHFAGIPDFSYTIYDWANKNQLCPSRPANDQQLDYCHVYALWHGAGFNASHFGSQATASYLILHDVALDLAADAAAMLDRTTSEDERTAHRDAIREAELLALAYEAYAQHFLSDRWATGHMWDRWGAPEYNAAAYGNELGSAVVTGLFTGILHGYESVAEENVPDAMSSPEYLSNTILGIPVGLYTPDWRFANSPTVYEGVGDYRLEDLEDGFFGKEYAVRGYSDTALNASFQREAMMMCLASSFGEVIALFGTHPDGGLGIDRVRLAGNVQSGVDDACLNPWATNRSIEVGWGAEGKFLAVTGLGAIARYVPALKTEAGIDELGAGSELEGLINAAVDRVELAVITARINMRAFISPDGVDLAQGGIGSYGDAKQAGAYPAASYFEPTDLDSLPVTDARGRDRETLFGLFNRARAGYFCQNPGDYLNNYRGSQEDSERAACRILAQRMYAGTWEGYKGQQAETQSVQFAYNTNQVRPLCQIASNWTPPTNNTDATPYRLHPGYVPWTHATVRNEDNTLMPDGRENNTHAYLSDAWELSNQSIAAWCDMVPVINLLEASEDRQRDIVARITDIEDSITLTGLHFGSVQGRLFMGKASSNLTEITGIEDWSDTELVFSIEDNFSEIEFSRDKLTFIFVDRAAGGSQQHGLQSVGRFALLDEIPRPEIRNVKISRGDTVFLEHTPVSDQPDDPGAFADNVPPPEDPEPFRPIDPGPVQVELEFDRPMDKGPEQTSIHIGGDQVTGEWISDTKWRGNFELLGGDFFLRRLGFQTLEVYVKAENGGRIDSDPRLPGEQPYADLEVLLDIIPIWVDEIKVTQGRQKIYGAKWIGGPDMKEAPNLTAQALNDPHRGLTVSNRVAPPETGSGEISISLSSAVRNAPEISIGGVLVTMSGEGRDWTGSFDYAAVTGGMTDGRIPISIRATDDAEKQLDGDPRTVTQIQRDPYSYDHWIRYEDGRGGVNSPHGGADTWHFLAAPVDLSFVIILDGSGSMDDSGRMEMAKGGIEETLAQLPEDLVVEVGAVVFSSCSSIQTYPFTRDHEALAAYIRSVSPDGGTALARAHYVAGNLFDSSADPGAGEWRFASFTDGEETCDGNVAAAVRDLSAKTREHRATLEEQEPEAPPEPDPVKAVQCNPSSWRAYQVQVTPAEPFDTIGLVEHWFIERSLPDGRCFARLQTRLYYVYYGSGPAASGWGVNSSPSEDSAEFGTSSKGEADLNRVRNMAEAVRNASTDLGRARSSIASAVARELE
ncbi:MAG: VWA domain-containing protein [Rhodobacteraceae bacterium]|nr:VWA domain-containing protein [Paracoccaceae bacterium]